jgi:hypothetical protein
MLGLHIGGSWVASWLLPQVSGEMGAILRHPKELESSNKLHCLDFSAL